MGMKNLCFHYTLTHCVVRLNSVGLKYSYLDFIYMIWFLVFVFVFGFFHKIQFIIVFICLQVLPTRRLSPHEYK